MTLRAFEGWVGPRNAKTVLVGEAWGREEEAERQPFVGTSGQELWRLLGEANQDLAPEEHHQALVAMRFGNKWVRDRRPWLHAASIAFTNVFNLRPKDNKIADLTSPKSELPKLYSLPSIASGRYVRPEFLPELDRLHEELAFCRPNLVVALGNTACWALLRTTNISQIRGTTTEATITGGDREAVVLKVLPTWHPAGLLYEGQWSRRPILVADLMKASREAAFPEIRRPHRVIRIQPESIEEWESWCKDVLSRKPSLLGCDTETSLGHIDTIGFSLSREEAFACQIGPHRVRRGERYETVWPHRNGQKVVHYWSEEEELRFWLSVRSLLESGLPLLFQNGLYDLQYLLRMKLRPANLREDLMLLHHSLFPEMQKGLGFLGSIYTNESSWKLMRREADTTKRDE